MPAPAKQTTSRTTGSGGGAAEQHRERAEDDADERADGAPDDLLGAEPLDVGRLSGAQQAAADGGGTAEEALDGAGEVGEERTQEPGHAGDRDGSVR